MGRHRTLRGLVRGLVLGLVVALVAPAALAGTFAFVEFGDRDWITHPAGYDGNGGAVTTSVCIDPTSANAAEMEIPVKNAIDVWNGLAPTTGNLAAANVPPLRFDFESVALHEIGHCIGLGHPNVGSRPGVSLADSDFTNSTDGAAGYVFGAGSDGIEGSADDQRGDNVNYHWFEIGVNDPFRVPGSTDSSTMSQDLSDLPGGDAYVANCDVEVALDAGLPNTQCVMQQGTARGQANRVLGHDDVATIRLARSGSDETEGTGDDYTTTLSYAGLTDNCDIVLDFDDTQTSFGVCQLSGQFIDPPVNNHIEITSARIYFNTGTQAGNPFDWFFNPNRLGAPSVPALPLPGVIGLALLLAGAGTASLRRRR